MHRMYLQAYEPEVYTLLENGESNIKPKISYNYYREYFNTHFALSFGRPQSDTCVTCEQLQIQVDAATDEMQKKCLQESFEEHKRKAQRFYTNLNADTQIAKRAENVRVITFYMQNLPLPHLPIQDVFYCRQLWFYIFGVHECGEGSATMYCYDETVARKSPNEVVSLLDNYFRKLPAAVTTLNLYSDVILVA